MSELSENAVTSGDAEGPPEAPQLVRRAIAGRPAWVRVSDLHAAWVPWAADDGAEPLSKNAFGEAMDRAGYPAVKGAKGLRVRRGIGLLSADEDDS